MTKTEKKNPWAYAIEAGRDYLTPEDVADAIKEGAERLAIYETVLDAINRKSTEDTSLCAFVAVHSEVWKLKGK